MTGRSPLARRLGLGAAPLRAQRNAFRDVIDLSGIWGFQADPDDRGRAEGWAEGLPVPRPIAIPGSWNEQLAEAGLMNFMGPAWCETTVYIPPWSDGRRRELRFGSLDLSGEVWVDGVSAGFSGPAMLPFALDLTDLTRPGAPARIVVRIDARLAPDDPTPGVTLEDYAREGRLKDEYFPAVRYDFFPFGGIARPPLLIVRPREGVDALRADVGFLGPVEDRAARITAHALASLAPNGRLTATLSASDIPVAAGELLLSEGVWSGEIVLEAARLWSPEDPFLFTLALEATGADGEALDRVETPIGLRDVKVDGARLLLNGAPITLQGFGKHEDAPFRGRGLDLPLLVKDFELLRWIGANSFRTSHYPYADEWLDAADRAGVLVISELFSVNIDFRRAGPTMAEKHIAALEAQVARDRSHPCVIAWSLSNEPGYLGEPEGRGPEAAAYWAPIYARARELDESRPLTHANVGYCGLDDPAVALDDFVTLNRYYGWYGEPGQLDRAAERLRADLDAVAAKTGKPAFLGEFGADAVAGMHATHDQLWTEEYQARMIAAYWRVISEHPHAIGGHVWNFADFRTAQHGRRAVLNHKGVFTRTRDPKRAAFALRKLWAGRDDPS